MVKKEKLIIEYLHEIQDKYGFISQSSLKKLSSKVNKSPAELYETASSYAYFTFSKKPQKVIKICDSPVCHMKGSENLLKHIEKLIGIKVGEDNAKVGLETTQCLGLCDEAPVMAINHKFYTKLTKEKITKILKKERII
jgi:NADH-quinone oxidoreductase subunit E